MFIPLTSLYFILHTLTGHILSKNSNFNSITYNKNITRDGQMRLVSCFHHFQQIIIAFYMITILNYDRIFAISTLSKYMVANSFAYFIYDFTICINNFRIVGIPFILHALSGLLLFGGFHIYQIGHWYAAFILLWETSSPFVHIHWLLTQQNKRSSVLYMVNGIMMFITFGVFRIILGIPVILLGIYESYQIIPISAIIPIILISCVGTYLNFIWFNMMIKGVSKMLKSRDPVDGWLCVVSGIISYSFAGIYCIYVNNSIFGTLLILTSIISGMTHFIGWDSRWAIADRIFSHLLFIYYCKLISTNCVHIVLTIILMICTYGAALVAYYKNNNIFWYRILHTAWHITGGVMIIYIVNINNKNKLNIYI